MAKIASSKPYGSGKAKTPTKPASKKEIEAASPLRTSPRRRNSEAVEVFGTEAQLEDVKVSGGRGKKPIPPTFFASKKKAVEVKPKSPRTPGRGRRKSALEPVVPSFEPEEKREPVADEIEDIFKYVNYTTTTEEEEEEEEEDYVESIRQKEREEKNLTRINEKDNSPMFVEYEISGESLEDFEHETTPSDEEVAFHFDSDEIETSEGSNSEALNEEEYNDRFKYNSSNVRLRLAQYFQRQESALSSASSLKNQFWTRMKEWVNESVIPSAKEFGEVTVEYTKKAMEQFSKRLEKKDESGSEKVYNDENDVSIYEDEPKIYEITEEEEIIDSSDMDVYLSGGDDDGTGDNKRAKLMEGIDPDEKGEGEEEDEDEEEIIANSFILSQPSSRVLSQQSSLKSSYHSIPADETLLITPQKQENNPKTVYSEFMDSRLTEIVLFFAKCTRDTPISSIYEHLEEFFTLKGENSLNLTEKQLVSSVLKDFLTEKDEIVSNNLPPAPVYEPIGSPKRIKILPGSGIRFRAPKFTVEEEVHLEELEQMRQKNLDALAGNNKISTLSTPQQRNKLQRKLLAPERTAELIEGMPENRGKSSNTKSKTDSVSSAIENIISQKIKEAKKREETERLETEKLKARVAELERESRERATKEALLQKQLEEQKKELEIERAAGKEKLENLKAAANLMENKSNFSFGKVEKKEITTVPAPSVVPGGSVGFSFGKIGDKNPSVGFNFGDTSKATAESINFEAKAGESKTEEPRAAFSFGTAKTVENKAEDVKTPAPFASFSFGKKEISESAEKSTLNPKAPAFNFGSKNEDEAKSESKPMNSFGFSFGNSTVLAAASGSDEKKTAGKPEEKSVFNFGAGKSETAVTEAKSGFSFGSTVPADDVKPANFFNFGASNVEKPAPSPSAFSFGSAAAEKTATATSSAFNFGSSTIETGKKEAKNSPTFSFGAAKPAAEKTGFSFGAAEPAKRSADAAISNVFGSAEPAKSSTSAFGSFNFGSSPALPTVPSPQPSTTVNNGNNPFAALNSASNIFSSAPAMNSKSFSFGAHATFPPVPSANAFSFPPISPSNGGGGFNSAPIVPMNFGNSATQPGANDQPAEIAFQSGARAISIPKRRRK